MTAVIFLIVVSKTQIEFVRPLKFGQITQLVISMSLDRLLMALLPPNDCWILQTVLSGNTVLLANESL